MQDKCICTTDYAHFSDITKHITATERTNWDNKVSKDGDTINGDFTLDYTSKNINPHIKANSMCGGMSLNIIGVDKSASTNDIHIGGDNGDLTQDYAIETFSNNFIVNSDLQVKGNIYATGEILAYSPAITTNTDTFKINGDLNVEGDTYINSDALINGDTTFNGVVEIKGGLVCEELENKIADL